jgi:URI fold toxin 2
MTPDHGNSLKNEREHHLYEPFDTARKDVFKFGICAQPLNPDGSSPRGNEQDGFLNKAVGWLRFIVRVLLTGIPGRIRACETEDEHIENYYENTGKYPPGNDDHKKLKKRA